MGKRIAIKTKRYSTFIKHIFEEYNNDVDIFIEGNHYSSSDIPKITEEWCKNSIIKKTIDFNIMRDGLELFGFHDTPDDFWASMSEQPFVERMAKEKIVSYRIYPLKKTTPILKKCLGIFKDKKRAH